MQNIEVAPLWVLDLLGDEVECIPARVGVQSRVECQGHVPRVQLGVFERILKVVAETYNTALL